MTQHEAAASVQPLRPGDPPELGAVLLEGRLASNDAGIVYAGRLDDEPAVVVLLTAGAEGDSYARARFSGAVQARSLVGDDVLATEDDQDVAPWVAVRVRAYDDGLAVASLLLSPVMLADQPSVGDERGPTFRPHWFRRAGPGRWRLWPLPWPRALTSGERWTFVASFALILAISAIALFIAVQLFEHQPPVPKPRPGQGPGPLPIQPPTPTPTPTPSPTTGPTPSPNGGPTVTIPPIV